MHRLFWLDMEMTGLEPRTHRILEAAVVVTDWELKSLHSWSEAVFQTPEVLSLMDDWCTRTHGNSGLLSRVPQGISEPELDDTLCKIARTHLPGEKVVLCGNSIGQDRRFVEAWLPRFSSMLHYRLLDVSSFKIVFEHRFGKKYAKKNKHTAVEDIHESIEELRYYLSFLDPQKLAEA